MLPDTIRSQDQAYILRRVFDGDCCAVVGLSNTGKSHLLRTLARTGVRERLMGDQGSCDLFVYVDFNLMLEATEQGFYEVILRCLMEQLGHMGQNTKSAGSSQVEVKTHDAIEGEEVIRKPPGVSYTLQGDGMDHLESAYRTLVAPPTAFQISLSFSEGLTAVCQSLPKRLVLLFDEFDEPFEQIEGRAFLNLRAIKDKYRRRLGFVTASDRRLSSIRRGRDIDEFVELLEPFTRYLSNLSHENSDQIIDWVAEQEGYTFDDEDRSFLHYHGGGHLGLLLAICRALGMVTGEQVRDAGQDWLIHRQVREGFDRDLNIQAECRKLWDDLTEAQQDAILAVVAAEEHADQRAVESLRRKGLLHERDELLFSPVFEAFVRRQRLTRRRRHEGVRLDVESGSVWVDAQQTSTLTDLEYRLLLLLYGRLDKICDKYQIVEAVWGEEYIDQVDDARIDKLLSRLRAKIEPDPRTPRYILTMRGRGYKLVSP